MLKIQAFILFILFTLVSCNQEKLQKNEEADVSNNVTDSASLEETDNEESDKENEGEQKQTVTDFELTELKNKLSFVEQMMFVNKQTIETKITRPSVNCQSDEALTWNGAFFQCIKAGVDLTNLELPIKNAATLCQAGQYLDGDGSCKTMPDSSNFTNTNAATLCNAGEYLDGDGTCKMMPAIIPDTNASTICNQGEFLDGSGACISLMKKISSNKTIKVNKSGQGDYTTIKAALDYVIDSGLNSMAGEVTIKLDDGIYNENVHLFGANLRKVNIVGNNQNPMAVKIIPLDNSSNIIFLLDSSVIGSISGLSIDAKNLDVCNYAFGITRGSAVSELSNIMIDGGDKRCNHLIYASLNSSIKMSGKVELMNSSSWGIYSIYSSTILYKSSASGIFKGTKLAHGAASNHNSNISFLWGNDSNADYVADIQVERHGMISYHGSSIQLQNTKIQGLGSKDIGYYGIGSNFSGTVNVDKNSLIDNFMFGVSIHHNSWGYISDSSVINSTNRCYTGSGGRAYAKENKSYEGSGEKNAETCFGNW